MIGFTQGCAGAAGLKIATPNGVDEQTFVEAGGIEHSITIRGLDRRNPIILFVHGGPAEIVSFVPAATQAWEQDFTVVHWDQRGAGCTYARNAKPPADLTLEQMTADGVEAAAWLTRHLGQPRLILVGHSMVRIRNAGHYAFVTHAAEFRDALLADVVPLIGTVR